MGEYSKRVTWIRGCLLAVGVILAAYGIYRGDQTDVLNKAIRICYECIGIG